MTPSINCNKQVETAVKWFTSFYRLRTHLFTPTAVKWFGNSSKNCWKKLEAGKHLNLLGYTDTTLEIKT